MEAATTIRTRRLAAGLTQDALARKAGISAITVSRIERGLKATPLTLARLVAVLDAVPSLAELAKAAQSAEQSAA